MPHLRRELKEARARRDELLRELDALRGEKRGGEQPDLRGGGMNHKFPRGLVLLG